ncbi:MAG: glycosyl hydrolase, partial [Putridiphycobacter sp.]|nr:glycosyl hydrolase [Putridiphycobacter sp.]
VNVWPDNPIGYGAEGMKYRFQWNFPIFFSPHDTNKIYACSQYLHVSYNGGEKWEIISPDLSRNDSAKLVSSGGPITKDNTGVEYYSTIFAAAESPLEKGLLWCGSDDGLLHVSKDGGKNWKNVTPKKLPEWSQINSIEVDPFQKGGLYMAVTRYKHGDYKPYLYYTKNYGETWELIINGIPEEHFTRVIRADRTVKGLLYCGTEYGIYISSDNGQHWQPFQLNLPTVPITDLALKDNDLIIATQGRSFWILDDLNVIWDELSNPTKETELRLFKVSPTVVFGGGNGSKSVIAGTNHPAGVRFFFNIPNIKNSVLLRFIDSNGKIIRTFDSKAPETVNQLTIEKGLNIFNWNGRYEKADAFEGLLMWWGTLDGPVAPPGQYKARLICENDSVEINFEILMDPRTEGTLEDIQAQFEFLLDIRNKVDETHDAIRHMRAVKNQIAALNMRLDSVQHAIVIAEGKRLDSLMTEIESVLYQTKLKSNQDMLNYPIKLNNKLAHIASLASMGSYRPTHQMIAVKDNITQQINQELQKWQAIQNRDLPAYNALIREEKVNVIGVKE